MRGWARWWVALGCVNLLVALAWVVKGDGFTAFDRFTSAALIFYIAWLTADRDRLHRNERILRDAMRGRL